MKSKSTILLIIAFAFAGLAAAKAEDVYNNNDKNIVKAFLRQGTNYLKAGLTVSDTANWNKNDDWLEEVEGVMWNYEDVKRVTELWWSNSSFAGSLDVSGLAELTNLECAYNQLTALNVTGCKSLKYLSCGNNLLTGLHVSGLAELINLECNNNQITSLSASGLTALEEIWCEENLLASLNVSGCTVLEYLSCDNNQLTSLNTGGLTELYMIYCQNNELISLNVSGCIALYELYCYNNNLTALDVSGCTALRSLECHNNELTSLVADNCMKLGYIKCDNNQLTNLNFSGLKALSSLSCENNQLININVSNCKELANLYAENNHLANIDVSGCSALSHLDCDKNELSSLDVSGLKSLNSLHCDDNQLISLKVNIALYTLYCRNNLLTFSALPLPQASTSYSYAPQAILYGGEIKYGSEIDMSSEYIIAGSPTTYKWYDGTDEIPANKYTHSNGKFTFTDPSLKDRMLYCYMTNAKFPDFKISATSSPLTYAIMLKDEVSIDENNENLFINLYPNPCNDILTINNSDKHINNISLFDMSGKVLARYNSIDNSIYSIDISAYPSGTYLLDIDGESVRFVISR